jgi:putative PIG3 family NAD(P)H quinone oxidoreductase
MQIPHETEAVVIARPGSAEGLELRRMPLPQLGPHDLLVEVAAAGINRADVLQRQGLYRLPTGMPVELAAIPGLEVAGTVIAVGSEAGTWAVGEAVTALVIGGGYARHAVVDSRIAMPMPAGLTAVEAAGIPECAMTVWTNVFDRGRLQPGETLLVHGGNSGIGSTAIQLAAALGSDVIATAGSAEKCARAVAMGARAAVNYREEDFVKRVRELTFGHGADVILDMVGGAYVQKNIAVAAEEGRIVNVSYMTGAQVTLELGPVMSKRLSITGSTLRNRPASFKAELAASVVRHVWPLIAAGQFRPVIDSVFPFAAAAAGHRRLEQGTHIGKVMLQVA